MNICFMGTPDFAVKALKNIIKNGYNVTCVYTKAPKPKGRNMHIQQTPVAEFAYSKNIEVRTPKTLKNLDAQEEFINSNFDIAIVAAYGLILPKSILESPKYGCVNIHASLLPKWRGASPIQMAILHGDNTTGITTMKMDVGMDTGDILLQQSTPIHDNTTFLELWSTLGDIGSSLIIDTIKGIENNTIVPQQQNNDNATLAPIIQKSEGLIDFNNPVEYITRKIRAFNPFISTYFKYKNVTFKILQADADIAPISKHQCGEIVSLNPLKIACTNGYILPTLIQKEGSKAMPTVELLRGFKFQMQDIITK